MPGVPPVAAELADPNARPNQDFVVPVDTALRHDVHVTMALLESPAKAKEAGLSENPPADQVVRCLQYLRDRVGVPRDMNFAAARQLRAHLNWYAGEVASPST
ncbi:unnamed protein product [Discosporangium mesarthrocarpum]